MSAVGFEPTSANTVELESTPLDRSGTLTITNETLHTDILQLAHPYTTNEHTHTTLLPLYTIINYTTTNKTDAHPFH